MEPLQTFFEALGCLKKTENALAIFSLQREHQARTSFNCTSMGVPLPEHTTKIYSFEISNDQH